MAASLHFHVGRRIRHCRWMQRMTQQELAGKLRISRQQIQQYEKGEMHLSADRICEIAAAMGEPVSFFFEGAEGHVPDKGVRWSHFVGQFGSEVKVYSGV